MEKTYGAHGNRRAWLGVDPGVTTGWALVSDDGDVLGSGNFDEEHVKDGLDTLVRVAHNDGMALTAVVERIPRAGGASRLGHRLDYVVGVVREVLSDVYALDLIEVTPGEWKPSRVAKTIRFSYKKGRTNHERDAIRMTQYVRERESRRTHYAE